MQKLKTFRKALKATYNQQPRVITTDKYAAIEIAIYEMIYSGTLSVKTTLRRIKYLNNIIKQDHRFIKRKIKPMLGVDNFETAATKICGIETMHMIKKGQVEEIQCVLSGADLGYFFDFIKSLHQNHFNMIVLLLLF